MKNILTALITGSLWLCFCVNGFPQDSASSKPSRKFKHKSKVETTYDKTKDQTTTYLRPMRLLYKDSSIEVQMINEGKKVDYLPGETIWLTAYLVSPGKGSAKPEFVTIAFRSSTLEKTKFSANHSLTITLDGAAMDLGNMTVTENRIDDQMSSGVDHIYMLESLELPLPYETFLKITRARKVKVRLAGAELELSNDHLEAFRDLLSRVE